MDDERKREEFNAVLLEAMDETVRELLSPTVLESLYVALEKHYDITRDELPYRFETVSKVLSDVFGFNGSNIVGKNIARRLYKKLNLDFKEEPTLGLVEYIEIAKRELATNQD